jgi:hypothetical protein
LPTVFSTLPFAIFRFPLACSLFIKNHC